MTLSVLAAFNGTKLRTNSTSMSHELRFSEAGSFRISQYNASQYETLHWR